jgi:transcriptional regulator with XRE-family HTH domain
MTNLQEYRKKSGLSQSKLAKQAGVNLRTLQDYEQGRKNINLAAAITVQKLAEALGCASWELLEDE